MFAFCQRGNGFDKPDPLSGHCEPIVTGLLIDAKSVGKPGVVILYKATRDWLKIKMN